MGVLLIAATIALSACREPVAKPVAVPVSDPAITGALADPIMVDPQLAGQANTDVLRPADQPYQAPVPPGVPTSRDDAAPTLGARAREIATTTRAAAFGNCDLNVAYGIAWSNRLPEELSLPDGAQVSEGAGSDSGACRLRVVSFALPQAPQAALHHYRTRTRGSGYAISDMREGEAITLWATRARDGAAVLVSAVPDGAGSTVDVISNRGR